MLSRNMNHKEKNKTFMKIFNEELNFNRINQRQH